MRNLHRRHKAKAHTFSPRKGAATWKGLPIKAIGPRGGKIVGYSKGKPIYAGSKEAEKLVQKLLDAEAKKKAPQQSPPKPKATAQKLTLDTQPKYVLGAPPKGFPVQKKKHIMWHPGEVPPADWPSKYPGPGAVLQVGFKKQQYVCKLGEFEPKQSTPSMTILFPDGREQHFRNLNDAGDAIKMYHEGLPLDLRPIDKRAHKISLGVKAFKFQNFEAEIRGYHSHIADPASAKTPAQLVEAGEVGSVTDPISAWDFAEPGEVTDFSSLPAPVQVLAKEQEVAALPVGYNLPYVPGAVIKLPTGELAIAKIQTNQDGIQEGRWHLVTEENPEGVTGKDVSVPAPSALAQAKLAKLKLSVAPPPTPVETEEPPKPLIPDFDGPIGPPSLRQALGEGTTLKGEMDGKPYTIVAQRGGYTVRCEGATVDVSSVGAAGQFIAARLAGYASRPAALEAGADLSAYSWESLGLKVDTPDPGANLEESEVRVNVKRPIGQSLAERRQIAEWSTEKFVQVLEDHGIEARAWMKPDKGIFRVYFPGGIACAGLTPSNGAYRSLRMSLANQAWT
jgi:hypothetical protein